MVDSAAGACDFGRAPATRFRRRLVIMVKEPVAGRVKTRLGREIGPARATAFFRHTMANVVSRLSADARWQTYLSVAPAAALISRALPAGVGRIPQGNGDIGKRMQAIFDRRAALSPGPVVIIGTDIPEVRPGHIAAAFRALGRHDLVFGPAEDGGFWLVGMRRTPRTLTAFHDVRWSTADTLADCLRGLQHCRVATVATLRDADELADFRVLADAIGRRILPKPLT